MTLELTDNWHYAYEKTLCTGQLRTLSEDFYVEEQLGFEPEGEGEHLFLFVEKTDANTDWVARQIATWAQVDLKHVSYAGLKDRYAVTRQWFCVHLPGRCLEAATLNIEGCRVLEDKRHPRKLRKGVLKGNRFRLVIRALQGDLAKLEQRLAQIKQQGVPNYFTEQRFGHQFGNVRRGLELLLQGKRERSAHKRSLYFSAVRSYLFNHYLSIRIQEGSWNQLRAPEAVQFQHSHSLYLLTEVDSQEQMRCQQNEVHPTGPLWGKPHPSQLSSPVYAFDKNILQAQQDWLDALEKSGADLQRRALRLLPINFSWEITADQLQLEFDLNSGQYATAILRELMDYTNMRALCDANIDQ